MPAYRTDQSAKTHQEMLEQYGSHDLQAIAKLFVKRVPTRKAERVDVIVGALAGSRLKQHYDAMSPLEKSVIAEMVHLTQGRYKVEQFRAKFKGLPKRHADYTQDWRNRFEFSILDAFMLDNLMPADLIERFKEFVPLPPDPEIATVEELPEKIATSAPKWRQARGEASDSETLMVTETERAALHDLHAVLRLIDMGKISASETTKRVTATGAKAIAGVLRNGDFLPQPADGKATDMMSPFAWPLLLQSAGQAKLSGTKLVLTQAGKTALASPAHEGIAGVWQHWLWSSLFDEFSRIDAIKGQNRKGRGGLTDVEQRRDAVQDVLSKCPPGRWIQIDEFFRFFQATGVQFEVVENPWRLYLGSPEYGSLGYSGANDWRLLQGRYVLCLLWEYAATLGLVDVAYIPAMFARSDFRGLWGADELDALSRYDGLKYFRITPLGAYVLDICGEYTPTPPAVQEALRVLPNHEIVVTEQAEFHTGDALFLDRVCSKTNESTWKLDKARILSAIENGFRAEEIVEFLATKSANAIPANVAQWLEDTVKAAARLAHCGPAEIFEAVDAATALLIIHENGTRKLCYAAGETRIVVPAKHVTAFRREVRKLGLVAQRKDGSA